MVEILPALGRHFFHLLTAPRFEALNRESESSGSQPVHRMVRIVSRGQRP